MRLKIAKNCSFTKVNSAFEIKFALPVLRRKRFKMLGFSPHTGRSACVILAIHYFSLPAAYV